MSTVFSQGMRWCMEHAPLKEAVLCGRCACSFSPFRGTFQIEKEEARGEGIGQDM